MIEKKVQLSANKEIKLSEKNKKLSQKNKTLIRQNSRLLKKNRNIREKLLKLHDFVISSNALQGLEDEEIGQ